MSKVFALVRRPDIRPVSRHSSGLPRTLSGVDPVAYNWPRVVLLETREDGVFLLRYDDNGAFAGDTWHQSIEEAKLQAADEFGNALGPWGQVPEGVADAVAFAVAAAAVDAEA
jgi:hypothetical protein